MISFEKLADEIKSANIKCLLNESVANYTTLKVGGFCPLMVFPDGEFSLEAIIKKFLAYGISWRVLGGGSNILVRDEGIGDAVINLAEMPQNISIDGAEITADASVKLARVCREAAESGLSGIEFATGIPGTLGGAVAMNAGAFGGEMKNTVKKVFALKADGKKEWIQSRALKFGYRTSRFIKSNEIVLKAVMTLKPKQKEAIESAINEYRELRRRTQPISERSAGCVFKNPQNGSAGKLIEDAGLKGLKIGGASVSSLHANYIISAGASASDILTLIERIKNEIYLKHKITLEEEIIIW